MPHPKHRAATPFEFRKTADGKYHHWTLGRALKLKRENRGAWQRLPEDLRKQAESTVKKLHETDSEAELITLGMDVGNIFRRGPGRPRDLAKRNKLRSLQKQGLKDWKIGMQLYPNQENSKKAYDSTRKMRARIEKGD